VFVVVLVNVNKQPVQLQLCDTAGQVFITYVSVTLASAVITVVIYSAEYGTSLLTWQFT